MQLKGFHMNTYPVVLFCQSSLSFATFPHDKDRNALITISSSHTMIFVFEVVVLLGLSLIIKYIYYDIPKPYIKCRFNSFRYLHMGICTGMLTAIKIVYKTEYIF